MIVSNSQPQVRQRQNFGLNVNLAKDLEKNPVAQNAQKILSKMLPDMDSNINLSKIDKDGTLSGVIEPPFLLGLSLKLGIIPEKDIKMVEGLDIKIPKGTLENQPEKDKFESTLTGYAEMVEDIVNKNSPKQTPLDDAVKKSPDVF